MIDGDFFQQVDKMTANITTAEAVLDNVHCNDGNHDDQVVHAKQISSTSPSSSHIHPRRNSSTTTTSPSSYLRRGSSISSVSSSPSSPSLRMRRSSAISPGSLSLDDYQREQEMDVPDTVASKAIYFLHHVDPHKFTNAVIGINAGRCRLNSMHTYNVCDDMMIRLT